jgi:hypothetical protein
MNKYLDASMNKTKSKQTNRKMENAVVLGIAIIMIIIIALVAIKGQQETQATSATFRYKLDHNLVTLTTP